LSVAQQHARGALYVVPNLLGAMPPASVLPARTIDTARRLTHWIVETPKPARAFLKSLEIAAPIAALSINALPEHASERECVALLSPAHAGHDIGLLSDAGCPGVADPGALVVAAAHASSIDVVPLVGPSAILLALMASGMNGQQFAFHGYLPVKPDARTAAIRALEQDSRDRHRTQLFIETPYRTSAMLAALAQALQPRTSVCVAIDLTLSTEAIERRTAAAWRSADVAAYDRRPAIFLLEAERR